jgi:hypothetical protein
VYDTSCPAGVDSEEVETVTTGQAGSCANAAVPIQKAMAKRIMCFMLIDLESKHNLFKPLKKYPIAANFIGKEKTQRR